MESDKDLEPGTWIVAEVDGSLAANLGVQLGLDLNWVREARLGGLSGDIGLRIQTAVGASLGFSARGRHAIVVSRASADKVVRVRGPIFTQPRPRGLTIPA